MGNHGGCGFKRGLFLMKNCGNAALASNSGMIGGFSKRLRLRGALFDL